MATTIDSTSLVLGNATSKELDPDKDPHLYNRFSWAIAIFVLSIGLTAVGGLDLVQKFAIVLGFPLIFIVIFITISAIKAMKEDFGSKSKEEIIEICQKSNIKEKKGKDEKYGK